MSNIYVQSDTHFSHHNIRTLCNRPFESTEEMDKYMIDRWNSCVKSGDLVYHLGDICWYNCDHEDLLRRLNGQKILIKGNHDSKKVQKCHLWQSVKSDLNITINKVHVHGYHYPLREWNKKFHGGVHFYGHVHNNIPRVEGSWEVGVDNPVNILKYDWAPIPIEEAVELAQTKIKNL